MTGAVAGETGPEGAAGPRCPQGLLGSAQGHLAQVLSWARTVKSRSVPLAAVVASGVPVKPTPSEVRSSCGLGHRNVHLGPGTPSPDIHMQGATRVGPQEHRWRSKEAGPAHLGGQRGSWARAAGPVHSSWDPGRVGSDVRGEDRPGGVGSLGRTRIPPTVQWTECTQSVLSLCSS